MAKIRIICILLFAILLEISKAGVPPATSRQSIIRGDGSRHSFEIVHDKHVGGVWGESWPHGYGGLPAVYAPAYDHHQHRAPDHYLEHAHPPHYTPVEILPGVELSHHYHSVHPSAYPHGLYHEQALNHHHGLEHLPVLEHHHGLEHSIHDLGHHYHGVGHHSHDLGHHVHGLEEHGHSLGHDGGLDHLTLESPHGLDHDPLDHDLEHPGHHPHNLEYHGPGPIALKGPHDLDHFNSPEFHPLQHLPASEIVPIVKYVSKEHDPHHELHGHLSPVLFIPHEEHHYAPHYPHGY